MLSILFLSAIFGIAAAGQPGPRSPLPFLAEIEGKIVIGMNSAGHEVVWCVPESGLPILVVGLNAPEWRSRTDNWVEIKGLVGQGAEGAEMEMREFSLERHPPRPGKPPLESEGILDLSGDRAILRTGAGEVPLVGAVNRSYGSGSKVELEGTLVAEAGGLAISVAWMERD
jgi:hypothetical protein